MKNETTIEDQIFSLLSKGVRGRIFFAQEFYGLWPDSSVRFALSNLARDGKIARLARGVFCFPQLTEYGMKMILPQPDDIACAVAEKTNVRIVPVGDQAAYNIGLTGLNFNASTYLTDGAPRRIHLSNGRTIEFRHTSEMRIFAFASKRMQAISSAIRAIGRENISDDDRDVLKWQLSTVSGKDFRRDLQLCPEWVRNILYELRTS